MPLTLEQQKSLEALKQKGYSDNQIGQMTVDYANQTGRTQDLQNLQKNIQDTQNKDALPGQRVENINNTISNQQQSGSNMQAQEQTAVENKNATFESQNQQKLQDMGQQIVEKYPNEPKALPKPQEQPQVNQYQDSSEERMAQITQNLNNYAQTNPELFSDRSTFDKAFEYQQRNDKQKVILDSFFNRQKANSYTNGDLVYKDFQNGNLTQADLDNMKAYNPGVYQQYIDKQNQENAKNKFTNSINVTNTMFSNLSGTDTSKSLTAQDKTNSPFQYMLDFIKNTNDMLSKVGQGVSYIDYKNLIDNDDILNTSKTQLDGVNSRIIELNSAYKNLEDDMKARIVGEGGVSKSEMLAMVAEKSKPLTRELENLTDQATLITNKIQTRKAEIDKQFEIKQKEVEQQKQDIQNKLQNFSIAYGIYKDQRDYQQAQQDRQDKINQIADDRAYQEKQAALNWDRQYGNIDSTDARAKKVAITNAVTDIMNQYKDWTFSRSKSEMINDITKLVDSGVSLGDAISQNITGQLSQNPQFKNWIQQQTNPVNYVEVKDNEGNSYMVNKYDPTEQYRIGGGTSQDLSGLVSNVSSVSVGTKRGECVAFVNDELEKAGLGSFSHDANQTLANKISKINSDIPAIGSVLVRTSPTQPKYGDVAIVTGVDDKYVYIKGSNKAGEGKVYEQKIPIDSASIKGYYNPNLGQKGNSSSAEYPQYRAYFEQNGKLPTGIKEGTQKAEEFKNKALEGYYNLKQGELKGKGFKITNKDTFLNLDNKTRQALYDSIDIAQTFNSTMDNLIKQVEDNGAEVQSVVGVGKEMNQNVRDLQLKAKEIYNLGVLNGPDLALMESIITNPTGPQAMLIEKTSGKEGLVNLLQQARDKFNNAINIKGNNVGISQIGQQSNQLTDNIQGLIDGGKAFFDMMFSKEKTANDYLDQ